MHDSQEQTVISQNKTELKDGTLIHKPSSQLVVYIQNMAKHKIHQFKKSKALWKQNYKYML